MKFKGRSITDISILVIAGFFIAAQYKFPTLQEHLFLIKRALLSDGQPHGTGFGEWWRFFTVALTHASWTHLILNMLFFHQIGSVVEAYYGKWRYLILMALSLLGASFVSNYFAVANVPAVGASGMLYGLFGAFMVVAKRVGADQRSIYITLAINLAFSFSVKGIDWHAHVGGLISGAIVGYLLLLLNGPKQRLSNI